MNKLLAFLFVISFAFPLYAGSLTGKTPSQTYRDLLFLDNSNNGLLTSPLYVKSGNGIASKLSLTTAKVNVDAGAFQIGGIDVPSPIGTVTSLSVVASDGLTASVTSPATLPILTIGVNAITPAKGGTGRSTPLSVGSVPFTGTGGILQENNSVFFWDGTNNRLGVGTNSPDTRFHQTGKAFLGSLSANQNKHLLVDYDATNDGSIIASQENGLGFKNLLINFVNGSDTTRSVGIGKVPTSRLDVNGVTKTAGLETTFANNAGDYSTSGGNVNINLAGKGIQIKEGSNARMGVCTLAAGTCTVANTTITGSTRVFLTHQVLGGGIGVLRLGTVTAGTSFVINSSSGTDTSIIAWLLIEASPF